MKLKHIKIFVFILTLVCGTALGQSFEVMVGNERLFIDSQWLKRFERNEAFSVFSRARATTEYDGNSTNLFTAGYLNYTTKIGLGPTVIGRVATAGSGIDFGFHFFLAKKGLLIFVVPSIAINEDLQYSFFGIARYTRELFENWNLYSSLELFSAFNEVGYQSNVQRIRLGMDYRSFQFGFAVNLNEFKAFDNLYNFGMFLRKQF